MAFDIVGMIKSIGDAFKSIFDFVDDLHYSTEEKEAMKLGYKKLETQLITKAYEIEAERNKLEIEKEKVTLEKVRLASTGGIKGIIIYVLDSGWRKVIFWTATIAFCYSTYLVFTSSNPFTPEAFKQMIFQGGEVLALAMIRQYDKNKNGK